MASAKPAQILKSKTDLTDDEINQLTDQKAWEIIYSLKPTKPDYTFEICITGFSPPDKTRLKQLAEENNIKVRTSVTKNMNYLVIGDDPGPSKLEKARETGKKIITKPEFMALIQTGELPN